MLNTLLHWHGVLFVVKVTPKYLKQEDLQH